MTSGCSCQPRRYSHHRVGTAPSWVLGQLLMFSGAGAPPPAWNGLYHPGLRHNPGSRFPGRDSPRPLPDRASSARAVVRPWLWTRRSTCAAVKERSGPNPRIGTSVRRECLTCGRRRHPNLPGHRSLHPRRPYSTCRWTSSGRRPAHRAHQETLTVDEVQSGPWMRCAGLPAASTSHHPPRYQARQFKSSLTARSSGGLRHR
jgi:hypothetical protein